MAKVAFSKLKCKVNDTEVPVQIGEETIMVKQYLPIQDKLSLIERVISYAHEPNNNYSNPVKVQVYSLIEMILQYTNIEFTQEDLDVPPSLYDSLISSEWIQKILEAIPEDERNVIKNSIDISIEAIYAYENSVLGILDSLKNDYEFLSNDVEELQEKLHDPKAFELLKNLLTNFN